MTTTLLTALPVADSWGMHGYGGWAPMMLAMAVFWGAIILALIWLIRSGSERRQRPPEQTPLTILDRRFAEGAVSLDEYQQRKDALAATTPRPDQNLSPNQSERRQR